MSASTELRRLRHLFGKERREDGLDFRAWSSGAGTEVAALAVNPLFVALGGAHLQILPLRWTGKASMELGRVRDVGSPVSELCWNPFSDYILASGSEEGLVSLWRAAESGGGQRWGQDLRGHQRRVTCLQWHPCADGVLASGGADGKLCLWATHTATLLIHILSSDGLNSLSFTPSGDRLLTTSKDRCLRVFQPRTGTLLAEWEPHEGSKASRAVFLGDTGLVCSAGFSSGSRRELALWRATGGTVLQLLPLDPSSALLFPHFDVDLNLLFLAGKGDGNIRYYQLDVCEKRPPLLHFLSEFQSKAPQHAVAAMPKRGLEPMRCEVARFYKLHSAAALLEPVTFVVPRKTETFHLDLFPPTAGPVPGASCEEWLAGLDRPPVKVSLRPSPTGLALTTSAPPPLPLLPQDPEHPTPPSATIASQPSYHQKFHFLSQVTCPDYRDIKEREDYPEIIKEQEIREKIYKKRASGEVEAETREVVVAKAEAESSEMESEGESGPREAQSSSPHKPSSSFSSDSPHTSPKPSPKPSPQQSAKTSPLPKPKFHHTTTKHHAAALTKPNQPILPVTKSQTRPGRIGGRGVRPMWSFDGGTGGPGLGGLASADSPRHACVPQRQRAELGGSDAGRPPVVYHPPPQPLAHAPGAQEAPTVADAKAAPDEGQAAAAQPAASGKASEELGRLRERYAKQSERMRELMAEAEAKEKRLAEADAALKLATEDSASYRFEIEWKDRRIEALESQLKDLCRPGPPHSASPSPRSPSP